jgi:low temperature requirement protein LtrA
MVGATRLPVDHLAPNILPPVNEAAHRTRLSPAMREGERVKPLELFFDLVYVLAITQCTALILANPSWVRLAEAMLVLALLWWAWTGYAWLTSVVDPEEGAIRVALIAAMAALLLVSLAVPDAFDDGALEFAVAYSAVRVAHIALFLLASRDNASLRRPVLGITGGTAAACILLIAGALLDTGPQIALWTLALAVDIGEPYFTSAEGWRMVPLHFAERHGLIVIVALGETIVALGVGAEVGLTVGVAAAAVLGIVLVSELWWIYFDVVAIANVRRLVNAPPGQEQNAMARDVYSYLHFPLVAGIVIAAFGLHETLAHVEDPLDDLAAFALLGGVAIYLLGHVAVRRRGARTWNRRRVVLAAVMLALIPAAEHIASLAILAVVTALLAGLIAIETRGYGEGRTHVRRVFYGEESETAEP